MLHSAAECNYEWLRSYSVKAVCKIFFFFFCKPSQIGLLAALEVEAMICSGQYAYKEITQHPADCGIRIFTVSVWRMASKVEKPITIAAQGI